MEPKRHGYKSTSRKAIGRDRNIFVREPGHYNIGFDYTKGFGTGVTCMYSGEVFKAGFERGYGYRIHIKLDIPFIYEGKSYTCYQAYAHCSQLLKVVGQTASQGEKIAIEAGHGSRGPRDYGSHVDLDTYCFIDGEKVHINFELLASYLKEHDFIEYIEVMEEGSSGLDVRWLQEKLNATLQGASLNVDGKFGGATRKAVEAYQFGQPDLVSDGIAGEQTCRKLGLVNYAIYCKQSTIIKSQPIRESDISNLSEKFEFKLEDEPLLANWAEDEGEHWKFELTTPRKDRYNWHAFKEHVEIVKGYDADINNNDDTNNLGDVEGDTSGAEADSFDRWERALKDCPTDGCLEATAQPEGLSSTGIAASHKIAEKDLRDNITGQPKRISALRKAAQKYNVPIAIITALASRESHLGSILGMFGNKPGWGDNNHGWGILQVDRRHHSLRGIDDPYSQAHIEQAMEIFSRYRDQVAHKHPDWKDEYILKGACVAYNSGVSNVATINGMNIGTTHDDYGDDVIARAQFYLDKLG